MAWDNAGNIISDAAAEIGLGPVADAYGSTDPNFIQLRGFLKSCGRQLVNDFEWTHLQTEYTLTTLPGVSTYPMPADFRRMIQQTGWNRSMRLPLGGPLSPQEWQYLKGRNTGIVLSVLFRPKQQQLALYPDTGISGGIAIAFEYESSYWVAPAGTTTGTSDAPAANTDVILFDPLLMMRAVKAAFLTEKGFATAQPARDAYEATLRQVKGNDSAAPVLSLAGPSTTSYLLGDKNIPITGFGS